MECIKTPKSQLGIESKKQTIKNGALSSVFYCIRKSEINEHGRRCGL